MKYWVFLILLIFIFSCRENVTRRNSTLDITSSDTTFLPIGNVLYQNAKFQVLGDSEVIFIQHGRKLFWVDMATGTIQDQINLDTTSLILPEVSLVNAFYDLYQKSTHLFFAQKNKILVLNSEFSQVDEIDLTGLDEIEHQFLPFGQVFYFLPSSNSYYVGIMSKKWQYNYPEFVKESSFMGVFEGSSGRLKSVFGEFSDSRKETPVNSLSEGIFYVDFDGNRFFIRDAVGSPQVTTFDSEGTMVGKDFLGNSDMNYELVVNDSDDISSGSRSDNHFSLKAINQRNMVSNAIKPRDESKNIFEDRGILFIEDLENKITYSRSIDPFQRIVSADENFIWLARNHPKNEELILVRINYKVATE
jgi:hypothetical protein